MMRTLADAAMPPLSDPTGCSFAFLGQIERNRLASLFGPLPWIDGLMAASAIASVIPSQADDATDWLDFIWSQASEDEIGSMTALQTVRVNAQLTGNFSHVANTLLNDPEAYRPYLGDVAEPVETAASWAHGFHCGTLLCRASWRQLIADQDALMLLLAIVGLIRDEDLPEGMRADSPFRRKSPEERDDMRRGVLEMLPGIVRSLHDHALDLDREDGSRNSLKTYARSAPKVSRNDPCPCGSGKKYKKCCLE